MPPPVTQALEVVRRQRAADEEALRVVAAEVAQAVPRGRRLDALGDDGQAEALGERDGRLDDRGVAVVLVHVEDEVLVDLQLVDGQVLEARERRVAGAEVVDREPDAELAQPREHAHRALRVGHDGVLGDLDAEPVRRDPGVAQQPADGLREVDVEEVRGCDVHRDRDVERPRPRRGAVEDARDDALGERPHQARLLDARQECRGHQATVRRVLPAHERLEAAQAAGGDVDLGLEMELELAARDAGAQLAEEDEAVAAVLVALLAVERDAALRSRLAWYIATSACLSSSTAVSRVLREEGDADARVDLHRDAVEHEGLLEARRAGGRPRPRRVDVGRRREHDGELVAAEAREQVLGATGSARRAPRRSSSRSPTWWPSVSLSSLKPSRSTSSRPVGRPAAIRRRAGGRARGDWAGR